MPDIGTARKRAQVRFVKGSELIRDYLWSKGVRRKFCTTCGARRAWAPLHALPDD